MLEDRLLKLLDAEQLSSAKFADAIGVQRSSISHILSGRNKPSFDFLQKTLKVFPMLNADWLILGEGNMYEGNPEPVAGTLFEQSPGSKVPTADEITGDQEERKDVPSDLSDSEVSGSVLDTKQNEKVNKKQPGLSSHSTGKFISRVIVFYNDKTFDSYEIAE
jgi:transcriptional regulator with XRE-family HTH domain